MLRMLMVLSIWLRSVVVYVFSKQAKEPRFNLESRRKSAKSNMRPLPFRKCFYMSVISSVM